jgi:CelD/BcsL family acetyltransferase involved in cellulose biosynthesis
MAELPALRTDSPQFTVLCDLLRARKFIFGIKPGNISPFIDLTRYQGWEGYLASRSKKFRKTLRNCLNRLERDSRLHVDEIGDIRSDPAVMQGVFAISRRSWKGSCHRDMAGGAESQRFYELLSTIASQRGWLRLWLLKVNGAPAAYEFALQFKETLFPLRADFDSVYKEFTPGTILHSGAVQDCFTRGLRELDFCGNDDGYKLRWTELERRHATIVIYNRTPLGILLYCWDYCFVHRIKHFLRRFTILRKLKKFYTRHD